MDGSSSNSSHSAITATNANVIAYRVSTGTYANRVHHCILKTTDTARIQVNNLAYGTIILNAIDPSIITTPIDKGEGNTVSATSGKYYIVSYYSSGDVLSVAGGTVLSKYYQPIADGASTGYGCAIIKATSNTITISSVHNALVIEL